MIPLGHVCKQRIDADVWNALLYLNFQDNDDGDDNNDDADEGIDDDLIPEVTYRPPPHIPSEAPGVGTNLNVYFVCNQREWSSYVAVLDCNLRQKLHVFNSLENGTFRNA